MTGNTARNNGKHGFIFSRGCDRNSMRANYSYGNAGHGFMIDDGRSVQTTGEGRLDPSDDNVVAGNVAYDNAHSGVEIEGGAGNVVSGNRLQRNDIGVRVKDGAEATISDNTLLDNDRFGINVLDSAGQIPVTGNQVSGSWAAINLVSEGAAALGANSATEVTAPLVVAGVPRYETSWFDEVAKYVQWNPLLVLWGLVLGLPTFVGAIRALESPFSGRRPGGARLTRPVHCVLLGGVLVLLCACSPGGSSTAGTGGCAGPANITCT